MKIRKDYLIDRIEYWFLFLFPFSIVFFNPSKEFLGALSITDIFVVFSMMLFFVYTSIKKVQISSYFLLLITVFVFSFLSLIVNEQLDFIYNLKYQLRWVFYIIVFLIIYSYTNFRSLYYLKRGLFIATFFVCVYSILQTLFKELFIPTIFWIHTFPDYINLTFRAVGTFDNPLNLCAFLAFPLGLLQYTVNKTKKEKVLNFLIYITLISTVSKIAVIIILVSFLVYFKKHIKFIIYGLISVLVIFFIFINISNTSYNKSYIYQRFNDQKTISGSVDTRLHMLGSSLTIIKANPIFGIGYENFEKNYNKLEVDNDNLKLSKSSFTSENFLLDFYLDNGLIPFLIMLFFLGLNMFFYFNTKNVIIEQFSFSILLFTIVGLIMSARTVPLMYLLFSFLAIIFKIQTNEDKTINNYSKLL